MILSSSNLKGNDETLKLLAIYGYSLKMSCTYASVDGMKQEAARSGTNIKIRNIFLDLCDKSNSLEERELDLIAFIKCYEPSCILIQDSLALLLIDRIQSQIDENISYYYYGLSDNFYKYKGKQLKAVMFVNMDFTEFFDIFDNLILHKNMVILMNNNYYDSNSSYAIGKRFASTAKPYHQFEIQIANNLYVATQYMKNNENDLKSTIYINTMTNISHNGKKLNNLEVTRYLLKYMSPNSIIVNYSYISIDEKGFITVCPDFCEDGKELIKLILSTYKLKEFKTVEKLGSLPIIYFDKKRIPYDDILEVKDVLKYYQGKPNFKIK